MANLKGGSFEKQLKDIHHRLSAFGESRYGKSDNKTHSSALADKRAEMSRSFAEFAKDKGLDGKLNNHITNENIKEFLDARIANFASSTAENYIRGFSSMIDGLISANIDINIDKNVFNDKVSEIKENSSKEIKTGRAIDNVNEKIAGIYRNRYESGVIAETQRELGLRVSEALELVKKPNKYIENGEVTGLIGKGNHIYINKDISIDLIAKIDACEHIPSLRTYQNDLEKDNIISHDFRYTYVAENYKEISREELSQHLNHSRPEMTDRYLARI